MSGRLTSFSLMLSMESYCSTTTAFIFHAALTGTIARSTPMSSVVASARRDDRALNGRTSGRAKQNDAKHQGEAPRDPPRVHRFTQEHHSEHRAHHHRHFARRRHQA